MSSASISDLFEISPSGEELLCIDRFIGDENFIKLCQEFQLSSTTTTRKAFHLYSRITSLVLRGNCLSVRSAQTLSNLISNNQTLLMISLEWNQLGSESLIFLANALPKNTTLQCLDLRNNGITNDGANILAHSLLQNTSLVKLDLRWNQITDEIVGNFEEIYKKRSTTPFTLLLHGNLLSPKMMDLIDEWNSGTLRKDEVVVPPPPQTHDRNIELDIRIRELKKDNDQLNHQIKELLHQNNDLNRQIHVSALRNTELEQTQLRQMHWITQLEENLRQAKLRLINVNNEYEMATSLWQREREEMQEKYGQELSEYTNLLKISSEDCLSLKNSLQKSKVSDLFSFPPYCPIVCLMEEIDDSVILTHHG